MGKCVSDSVGLKEDVVIFSKQNNFLFVKGRKVGGTSVEIALSLVCGPEDIITPITPIDELERINRGGRAAQNYSDSRADECRYLRELIRNGPEAVKKGGTGAQLYGSHMSLREFVDRFGSLPTDRVFCVERLPYSKIISRAVMAAEFAKYKRIGGSMSPDPVKIQTIITRHLAKPGGIEVCRNIELYRGLTGGVMARVLRQENLAVEFAALMAEYEISSVPELPYVKKGIGSNSLDPRAVFTREQLDRINDVYAEEFDSFGYERL